MSSVSSDRARGVNSGMAWKVPVNAATTAAITLSGTQTIDGVACGSGDRVLVKDQSNTVENGVYIVDSGAWSRAPDFDSKYDVTKGSLVYVLGGTANGESIYYQATDDPIPDSTAITFTLLPISLSGVSAFMLTVLDDSSASAARTTLGVSSTAEMQLDAVTYCVGAGAADAITGAFTPTIGSLTDGLKVRVRITTGANATTTPTFKADGTTAKTIVKHNLSALAAGDIPGTGFVMELTYNSAADKWIINNPASVATDLDGGTY